MKLFFIALALFLISIPGVGRQVSQKTSDEANRQVQAHEKAAQQVSDSWLALFDAGKYDETWSQASESLKDTTKKEDFVASLQTARSRVGKVLTRKLKTARYTAKLKGAPEGEYVVLLYESTFETLPYGIETVIPKLDKDGKWRVSGYHVDETGPPGAERAAQEAARAWLALFDRGKYEESWETAAQGLKDVAEKDQFIESLQMAQGRVGKVLSRKLKSSTYTMNLPGAPKGEYVVLQFESSFENLGNAIEVLVPMLDRDGKWRVSGYNVK